MLPRLQGQDCADAQYIVCGVLKNVGKKFNSKVQESSNAVSNIFHFGRFCFTDIFLKVLLESMKLSPQSEQLSCPITGVITESFQFLFPLCM